MNNCDQFYLSSKCNYPIENNDWRPTQELLLTRFGQVEYTDMFRTINQDCKFNELFYFIFISLLDGSFYHRQSTLPCIPDALKEKVYKRYDEFMNYLLEQTSHYQSENRFHTNLFPQHHIQTVK